MSNNLDMEILNLVHQLAAHSWKESSPSAVIPASNSEGTSFFSNSQQPCSSSSSIKTPLSNFTGVKKGPNEEVRSGRRIQPVSIPRKPPDIQNLALFPPIGDTTLTSPAGPNPARSLRHSVENATNPFTRSAGQSLKSFENNNSLISSSDLKFKQLENKLRGQARQDINTNPKPATSVTPLKARQWKSLSPQRMKPILIPTSSENVNNKASKEIRKAPRSAELFAELTPEMIKEVDSIAEKYSSLIDNNLCRSVLEELTFLLKLISSCGGAKCVSMERIGQLSTVAQQVYFVIKVLTLQLDSSLIAIDPKIIQILIQKYPHRIPKLIRKHFEKWAISQIEKKELIEPEDLSTQKPSEYHQCVTFRSETDGRPNFPNQGDFHAFCKQRDLFYSIKNIWAEREQTTFAEPETIPSAFLKNNNRRNAISSAREPDSLYPKIKALFNMNSSWGNLSHLASLFTSQYLLDASEKRQSRSEEAIKDEQMNNILRSNPNRLAQLQNRMSTATIASHSTIGARNEDTLAFSKYFLAIANSPGFNQHLIDRITFEISQIETSVESSESFHPIETELLLRKSILLARLLSYLVFLPYNDEGPNNRPHQLAVTIDKEAVVSKQIELRSYQQPPLNLKSKLITAFRQNRLTFTLPWIIEFLSGADNVSLQLPSFKETISLICSIYRSYLKISPPPAYISLVNLNFLRFWCGSLFALEKFPDSLLYSKEDEAILSDMRMMFSDSPSVSQRSREDQQTTLDLCDSFGDKLVELYFTPQFNKLASILHAGLQQQEINVLGLTSTTLEVKHIRPVPAKSPSKSSTLSKTIQLQLQLESSFFDSNSPSVKKTVDFIAERIASNYVKTLRTRMSEERCKLTELEIFGDDAASACRKIMLDQLQDFSENKCSESVNILIGDSISPSALCICQRIALRKCTEKVNEWIENHIKTEMFPAVELPMPAISAKYAKNVVHQETESVEEDNVPDSKANFEIMILLHRCLKKLHQGKPITENSLDDILSSNALRDEAAITGTIIDFGMALITFCPSMLTLNRQDQLTSLWRKHWNKECKLLNPRNLMMMQDSRKWTKESWKIMTNLVKSLIYHDVLNFETLEQDCLTLLRQDWPSELFSHLSHFLKELVSSFKTETVRDQESREVIDWVAWYCSNEFD